MMEQMRRYPIGIQTFSRIISDGYIYIDKTDLVWELAHYAKFVFINRPRRFGKSLLTSTLKSFFAGESELFEGQIIYGINLKYIHTIFYSIVLPNKLKD